jgi:hypothetical protein
LLVLPIMRSALRGVVIGMAACAVLSLSACGDDDAASGSGGAAGGGTGGAGGVGGAAGAGAGGVAGNDGGNELAATEDDIAFVRAMAALRAVQKDHPEIWPGYSFSSQALIGVDIGRRALSLQHPAPPASYPLLTGLPSELALLVGDVRVALGLEASLGEGQPFAINDYDGFQTFSIAFPFGKHLLGQPLPAPQEESLLATVTVHEVFHLFQLTWANTVPDDSCGFPLDDQTLGLGWLEHVVLASALEKKDAATGLEELAVARLTRHAAEPSIRNTEDHYDASEGTALFVDHEYAHHAGYAPPAEEMIPTRLLDGPKIEDFGRDRHYGVGAAISKLLDWHGSSFRSELAQGGRLGAIAAQAAGVDATAAAAKLDALLAKYQYDTIVLPAVVAARTKFEAERDAALGELEPTFGRLVSFELGSTTLGAFSHSNGYEQTDCSTVYANASVWWKDAKTSATITDHTVRADASGQRWEFRSAATADLVIDGTTEPFANGAHTFNELLITVSGWSVSAKTPGTITIGDDEIAIVLAK